jgi:predicted DNA-binding transcriptional regulator AlpA
MGLALAGVDGQAPPAAAVAAKRRRHRRAAPPPPAAVAPVPRLALDAGEAAAAFGLSRSFWISLVNGGRAPRGLKLGRCRRWSVSQLAFWAASGGNVDAPGGAGGGVPR